LITAISEDLASKKCRGAIQLQVFEASQKGITGKARKAYKKQEEEKKQPKHLK